MKLSSIAITLLFLGQRSLTSALEQPESYIRSAETTKDRELQTVAFWESGFCEDQLQQCYSTVSGQNDFFSTVEQLFHLIDDGTNALILDLRSAIALFTETDLFLTPSALEEVATSATELSIADLRESAKNLSESMEQANAGAADQYVWDVIWGAVLAALNATANLFGDAIDLALGQIGRVLGSLQSAVVPVASIGLLTSGITTLVNTLLQAVTGNEEAMISFCPASLITCSLEILLRFTIIAVTGAVFSSFSALAGTP